MFRNLTVRSKLLTIVATVALLFGATVLTLGHVAKRHVVASMDTEIERSQHVVTEFIDSRWRQLDAGLNSLVDSPEIRAVLTTEGMDHDTQLMSITDLQHMLGADAILYCDDQGRTLARTDDPFDEESIVTDISMIREALQGKSVKGFWNLDGQMLLAMAFAVQQDDLVKGVVLAGVDINGLGVELRELLLRDVVVSHDGILLTSSIPVGELESVGVDKLLQSDPSTFSDMKSIHEIRLVNGTWREEIEALETMATVIEVDPIHGKATKAVIFVPVDSIFGFYDDFRAVLMWMGAATIGLSVLITFYIGAIISGQVKETLSTLKKVAAGDLTARLDITSTDEFGSIASALNTAIAASNRTLDSLTIRIRDTKTLLNAVDDGFFTVDKHGVMSDERSGAVDRMLGSPLPGMEFSQFLRQFDANAADWIEMGLDDVFMEIMPVEVTIDQLPARFISKGRTFSIAYTPVFVDGELHSLAVVLSDVTAEVEKEQLEAEQRDMMSMVQCLSEDKAGFLEFIEEADRIIKQLRKESREDIQLTQRLVHTLKGNASIFGLDRIADACHSIEDFIAENEILPNDSLWTTLFGRWASVKGYLRRAVGTDDIGVELSEEEYTLMLSEVLEGKTRDELAIRIIGWNLETTHRRMIRIGKQASGLAARIGKGNITVRSRGGGLRIDPKHWAEFWSSFVHVVRNSVDHGLESPEDRRASGKSETGNLGIATEVGESEFVISISDDGRGINWDSIAAAAKNKGLPAETHEHLIEALFIDGLSTAENVTETSGRGVGMSAVRAATISLGGKIEVQSEVGVGTTFRFRFPIDTMAPQAMKFMKVHGIEQPERLVLGDSTPEANDVTLPIEAGVDPRSTSAIL